MSRFKQLFFESLKNHFKANLLLEDREHEINFVKIAMIQLFVLFVILLFGHQLHFA
jgi:hypothetical protein